MYLINKKVLVLGLGITGISTIKALYKLGAEIVISDTKNIKDLENILVQIENIPSKKYLNTDDIDLTGIDLVIKSPGIPPRAKIIKNAIDKNIEVITDIEFAYRLSPTKKLVAITGTNGKTTSTILTGKIIEKAGFNTHVVGNIGTGIMDEILDASTEDIFVIEASSFQLEHTTTFKPKVGLITNITPDHIDWHGSFENYIEAKLKVFKNQDQDDFLILNYDDNILRGIKDIGKGTILWFSIKEILSKGIYIEDGFIIINDGSKKIQLMQYDKLKILGKHNLENALACIGIALALEIDFNVIKDVLLNFQGVEHRIEFVSCKSGISFYNDSKGTNTDASIKAIEAVKQPIILIAGGYDKNSSYDDLVRAFKGKVKALILLGQTKDKIKQAALDNGFNEIYQVQDMSEAVELSFKLGDEHDNVLLSPACASWDMYNNYEERGRDFKNRVASLME